MSGVEGLEAMDLEKVEELSEDRQVNLSASCSICLDLVLNRGERSTAKLLCGHEFHLDCIGSAFNAKGAMQCPNCRKIEKGRWLYANGHRSSADFDLDAWVTEDFYDLNYPELPFGLQWCPFRGITQLASLFEEGETQLSSYHDAFGSSTFGDHSSASSSTHLCPYMALHGLPHPLRSASSSSAADPVTDNSAFHPRYNYVSAHPSSDMPSSHSHTSTETHNHNWQQQQQQHSFPFSFSSSADQSALQFGPRAPRSDSNSQQRLGSFAHPHSLNRSGPRSSINLIASLGPPVIGEVRGHAHNHIYQHSAPSSSLRSAPIPAISRSRPRGFTLVSSLAATTSADIGRYYGLTSVTGAANRSPQDPESMPRHYDRFYGWGGRESLTPLPWIPVEGESQWWSPFNPSQAPQSGGSFLQRANNATERVGQSRAENGGGYQRVSVPARMAPPPRMPPSSYM